MGEEGLGLVLLGDDAFIHKQHPGGHAAGKAHLVGDHHHGHALVGQLLHNLQHLAHHFRVQGRGGLVKEHHVRVHGQGPSNGNALLLAAGKLLGVGVGLVRQAHPLQQLQGLFVGLGLGHQLQFGGGQGDVLLYGHVGEQVELLEHHAHAGPQLVDVVFRVGDVHALKGDGAAGGLLQQVQAPQEGGLARAGGADDGHLLALVDVLVDALEDLVVPVRLGQVFNVYHLRAASFPESPGAR